LGKRPQQRRTQRKGTKLTPLGRLLALVVIITLGAITGAAGAAATRPHAQAWRCISVRPGETLWGIAGRLDLPGDRREVVQRITQENELEGRPLWAASAIWVPNEGNVAALSPLEPSSCSSHPD
jgi:hypothetical protein